MTERNGKLATKHAAASMTSPRRTAPRLASHTMVVMVGFNATVDFVEMPEDA